MLSIYIEIHRMINNKKMGALIVATQMSNI